MKRKLVCRNEFARHPLRAMLPPPIIDMALARSLPQAAKWWKREDTHLFLLSFCAFFVAISSFIS
jgi:hypothetical protein